MADEKVISGVGVNGLNDTPVKVQTYTPSGVTASVEAPSKDAAKEAPATEPGAPPEPEKTPSEKRAERRDALQRASDMQRKAVALDKKAKAEMAQASQVVAIVEAARKDPLELAKVLGVQPQELMRLVQNAMLGIKDDPATVKLTPEQETKQRLDRIETERTQERQTAAQVQYATIRQGYIDKTILPAITEKAEEYEMIHAQGAENIAGHVYDLMEAHNRKFGEILDVNDVLEEMESHLAKTAEDAIAKVKKLKKLSGHFREEAPTVDAPPVAQPKQLGAKRRTLSNTPPPAVPAKKLPMDRKSKLERMLGGR